MEKVFCIGFQKTGTTSMESALQVLGLTVASVYGKHIPLDQFRREYVAMGLARAAEVDAVQDMPWPLLFKDLDAAFPGAKFILTTRDEDAWWASILGHFGANPHMFQQLTYGEDAGAPLGNETRYREVYRRHNAAVRAYFADRPDDLLELDFSHPVGWGRLCAFLGLEEPDQPFPRSNQPRQSPSLKRYLRRKALTLRNRFLGS
ncbi:MAG: sulfotransferase family protein [Pseudooceanicola sp.]